LRVLLTGGRSPIAIAAARAIVELGGTVVLVTRRIDTEIEQLLTGVSGIALLEADLSSDDGLADIAESMRGGGFSGAVFAHRYRGSDSPLSQVDLEVLRPARILESIVETSALAPHSFVFFSSPAARVTVGDASLGYHVAKASMNAVIRYLATKLGSIGVRVNGVSPGAFVEKERSRKFFEDNPTKKDWAHHVTPLGRFAEAAEIGKVAAFLVSDDSAYISGQILEVDGGLSVRDLAGVGPFTG